MRCVLLNLLLLVYDISTANQEFCHRNSEEISESCTDFQLRRLPPTQTKEISLNDGRKVTKTLLAKKPLLFEIPEFLTIDECKYFIVAATENGLTPGTIHRQGWS